MRFSFIVLFFLVIIQATAFGQQTVNEGPITVAMPMIVSVKKVSPVARNGSATTNQKIGLASAESESNTQLASRIPDSVENPNEAIESSNLHEQTYTVKLSEQALETSNKLLNGDGEKVIYAFRNTCRFGAPRTIELKLYVYVDNVEWEIKFAKVILQQFETVEFKVNREFLIHPSEHSRINKQKLKATSVDGCQCNVLCFPLVSSKDGLKIYYNF